MTKNILHEEQELRRECNEEHELIKSAFVAELDLPRSLEKTVEIYSKYNKEIDRNLAWHAYKMECLHNQDRQENWGIINQPVPVAPDSADNYIWRSRLLAAELRERELAAEDEEDAEFAVILAIVAAMCDATAVAVRMSALPDNSANMRRLLFQLRALARDPTPAGGGGSGGGGLPTSGHTKLPSPKPRRG